MTALLVAVGLALSGPALAIGGDSGGGKGGDGGGKSSGGKGGDSGGKSGGDSGGKSGGSSGKAGGNAPASGSQDGQDGRGEGNGITCTSGKLYDPHKHLCVKAERGALPDAETAEYAYDLTQEKRYTEALAVLDLLNDPNTPRALNYRGYATRKLGRVDEGIGYYLKSIQLDPGYAQVREYLGEAYVLQGKLDSAKEQLHVIQALCGSTCEEYVDLQQAIEGAPEAL